MAWYLPGQVQFLLRNAGKIIFAAMNVYVAQGFKIVLECIRLEPLEKGVVNLHSHMKRMLHDTRLLTNTFFYLFPRLNGINFICSYMLQTPNQNLNFYLILSSKRQVQVHSKTLQNNLSTKIMIVHNKEYNNIAIVSCVCTGTCIIKHDIFLLVTISASYFFNNNHIL